MRERDLEQNSLSTFSFLLLREGFYFLVRSHSRVGAGPPLPGVRGFLYPKTEVGLAHACFASVCQHECSKAFAPHEPIPTLPPTTTRSKGRVHWRRLSSEGGVDLGLRHKIHLVYADQGIFYDVRARTSSCRNIFWVGYLGLFFLLT